MTPVEPQKRDEYDERIVKDIVKSFVEGMDNEAISIYDDLATELKAALDAGACRNEYTSMTPSIRHIRASAIGHCVRAQVIEHLFPMSVTHNKPKMTRIGAMGTATGKEIIDEFTWAGYRFVAEPFETTDGESYFLTGHLDGLGVLSDLFPDVSRLYEFHSRDAQIVLEVKSMHTYPFKNVVKDNMPRDSDLIQSHVYASMVDAELIAHVAVDRGDGSVWCRVFPVVPEIRRMVLERADYITTCIKYETIPSRPYEKKYWKCTPQYCDACHKCSLFPNEGGIVSVT